MTKETVPAESQKRKQYKHPKGVKKSESLSEQHIGTFADLMLKQGGEKMKQETRGYSSVCVFRMLVWKTVWKCNKLCQ